MAFLKSSIHDPVSVPEPFVELVPVETFEDVENDEVEGAEKVDEDDIWSLLKLSAPQTVSTVFPMFHFSGTLLGRFVCKLMLVLDKSCCIKFVVCVIVSLSALSSVYHFR